MTTNQAFQPQWIWVDHKGANVYAQGYGERLTVIFSFTADSRNPPTSLANRVCTKMGELETNDPAATFADIESSDAAIWGAIRQVWPQCTGKGTAVGRPGVVVAVDSMDSSPEKAVWGAYAHPLYSRFIHHLADESLGAIPMGAQVKFTCLMRYEQLGGRGCTTRVRFPGQDHEYAVFKGLDFRTALQHCDDEGDKVFRSWISRWRKEFSILHRMPLHPNILPAPEEGTYIVRHEYGCLPVINGSLFPLYPGGDVASRIEESNMKGARIPLRLKARWCADMTAAVFHTHRVAKTYHMDIQPANFVADENDKLILCDWEQHDAAATTIAPEADGTWDVTEEPGQGKITFPRLQYTKYSGPPRRNVEEGILEDTPWHTWNVFPIWTERCPWALELAEVFSLGRTMWMLLRQPTIDYEGIQHPDQLVTDWDDSDDIPVAWKQIVYRCMLRDPNERPDLGELVCFWTTVLSALEEEGRRFNVLVFEDDECKGINKVALLQYSKELGKESTVIPRIQNKGGGYYVAVRVAELLRGKPLFAEAPSSRDNMGEVGASLSNPRHGAVSELN
ncbi:hypothetical protein F4780DRAFT_789381 [Xylariomycetidae sp. FL0641]|nr:hypothetical protein F4780DRAFT_789381 [Xylariomycetidae sp. FL0641]